jgi:hypothetical protein
MVSFPKCLTWLLSHIPWGSLRTRPNSEVNLPSLVSYWLN